MVSYEERRADFEAFSEKNGNLQDDLSKRISAIRLQIEGESENAILSTDEDQYIDKLVADNTIQVPELLYDQITFDRRDVIVKRRGMDQYRGVLPESRFEARVPAYTYYIPRKGPINYLKYAPSPRLMWTQPVHIEKGLLSFEVIADNMNAEQVNREQEKIIENLKTQMEHMSRQLAGYNDSLRGYAKQTFDKRKEQAQRNRELDKGIKVPRKH
jgi:hypothetical protein